MLKQLTEVPSDKSINWINIETVRFKAPLFINNGPSHEDIVQGCIGSCWFLCSLISYLRPNSKNIKERQDDIRKSIRLCWENEDRRVFRISLNNKFYYVDDHVHKIYYRYTSKKGTCIWPILFEKAMLSQMTHIKVPGKIMDDKTVWVSQINDSLGEMKAATIGISFMLGNSKAKFYALHKIDTNPSLPHIDSLQIYTRFKKGEHVLANTSKWTYPNKKYTEKVLVSKTTAVQQHCYAILDIRYDKEDKTYYLTISNPWCSRELDERDGVYLHPRGNGVSIISWERFHYLFACVHLSV